VRSNWSLFIHWQMKKKIVFLNSKWQEHCKAYIFLVLLKETVIELNLMPMVSVACEAYFKVWAWGCYHIVQFFFCARYRISNELYQNIFPARSKLLFFNKVFRVL
jgi:hypothetical protein